jgi:hypothetical protein
MAGMDSAGRPASWSAIHPGAAMQDRVDAAPSGLETSLTLATRTMKHPVVSPHADSLEPC